MLAVMDQVVMVRVEEQVVVDHHIVVGLLEAVAVVVVFYLELVVLVVIPMEVLEVQDHLLDQIQLIHKLEVGVEVVGEHREEMDQVADLQMEPMEALQSSMQVMLRHSYHAVKLAYMEK